MRLAILCPGYGRVARGVETFTAELAERLLARHPEWQIDVFCRGPSTVPSPGLRTIHVPAVNRDGPAATLYARIGHRLGFFLRTRIDAECLSFTLALAPRLLRSKYDAIFNQAGPFAGRLLGVKRRRDGTPFIHKTAAGYADIELIMARQMPDRIIANSPYVGEWLSRSVPDSSIELIPEAVDHTLFRPLSSNDMQESMNGRRIDMPRPIVLFVGAMESMKRPELLISAAAKLPGVSLVMVGDGRLKQEVTRLGGRELGDRFVHVPYVSRDNLAFYYNSCDLFTLPSEEPFGIVFLEAMACNKPVLGHHSPVQEWIFKDGGRTCDCTDIDGYARAMEAALSTDFGDRPLARSREFGWPEITSRYEAVLDECSAKHNSR